MKTFAMTIAVVLGLTLLSAQSASAGGVRFYSGNYGNGYGNYYGDAYGVWRVNQNQYRGHYHYHDTSHYDYVPGGYVPHGNHLHYVPGQYQFHQDGHYDYHRGNHHHHH